MRCAGCKYLRRRCPPDCILSPYFPGNNPQRFACVHKIYGASNVTKMLQKVPLHQRAIAAESLCQEAYCRLKDPVYGCVGDVTLLSQQIHKAQTELAEIQAQIAVLSGLNAQNDQLISNNYNGDYSLLQGNNSYPFPTYINDPFPPQF